MRTLLTVSLSFILVFSYAQNPPKEVDVQAIVDDLMAQQDNDTNYEEAYENLLQLLSSPLDLNTATSEQLRMLGILSELQLQSFLTYRNDNGKFVSVYELQAVPHFDDLLIAKLSSFVIVRESNTASSLLSKLIQNKNSYLIYRVELQQETKNGFETADPDSRFLGSRPRSYVRYRNSVPGNFSVGYTLEQDSGEKITWNPVNKQFGADYISFHVQLMNKHKLRNFIIGDYQLQVGQGLVLGGAFGMGKGGETVNTIRKSNLLAIPYTSAAENGFMRGVVGTYQLTRTLSVTHFISNAWRDANTTQDSIDSFVTSILNSGLHRNQKELSDRKQLHESVAGGIIHYQNKNLEGGLVVQHLELGTTIDHTPNPYNQFQFQGNRNINISTYINYSYFNFTFFGELAKSLQGGSALIAGTLGSLTRNFDVALLLRNYQRNYFSFYTNALAESTTPQNEKGFYWGLKYRPSAQWQLSGYVDVFEFPWLRFRSYSPSVGYEWLLRVQYQPSKTISLSAQLREETKQRNIATDGSFYETAQGTKRNAFINADYSYDRALSFKTRLQFSDFSVSKATTKGMTLFQDVTYDLGRIKFSARYALFDVADHDNRQYTIEKDMWLAFSFPSYSDKGVRTYLMLQYDISKSITCWFRYAYMRVPNVTSMGTGVEEIIGNQRNDFKFQIRLRL